MPALSVSKLQKGIMFSQNKDSVNMKMPALSVSKMPKALHLTCKASIVLEMPAVSSVSQRLKGIM